MQTVIGVRFKPAGKVYYFDPGEIDARVGDGVIVETSRGLEFGRVVMGPLQVAGEKIIYPLKTVLRKATAEDEARAKENRDREKEALAVCARKIAEHGLPMKLVGAEYAFDLSKLVFYFTAEGRIDFRELVRDLAAIFRTRIELRQIGVRDEAKMLGGLGTCGRVICCRSFLEEFGPVSIRMAKDQNLSLNPSKISGLCGRLMCCLKFENEVYEEERSKFPDCGSIVNTPAGEAKVTQLNVLKGTVNVEFKDGRVAEYMLADIQFVKGGQEGRSTCGEDFGDNFESGAQDGEYVERD